MVTATRVTATVTAANLVAPFDVVTFTYEIGPSVGAPDALNIVVYDWDGMAAPGAVLATEIVAAQDLTVGPHTVVLGTPVEIVNDAGWLSCDGDRHPQHCHDLVDRGPNLRSGRLRDHDVDQLQQLVLWSDDHPVAMQTIPGAPVPAPGHRGTRGSVAEAPELDGAFAIHQYKRAIAKRQVPGAVVGDR